MSGLRLWCERNMLFGLSFVKYCLCIVRERDLGNGWVLGLWWIVSWVMILWIFWGFWCLRWCRCWWRRCWRLRRMRISIGRGWEGGSRWWGMWWRRGRWGGWVGGCLICLVRGGCWLSWGIFRRFLGGCRDGVRRVGLCWMGWGFSRGWIWGCFRGRMGVFLWVLDDMGEEIFVLWFLWCCFYDLEGG